VATVRDPELLDLLARSAPVSIERRAWSRPIDLSCHLGDHALPARLVTSIRVLVHVDDHVVVTSNADGTCSTLPGGRCEPGETWIETGCREVHEETGWIVDPDSFVRLGFMHLHNLADPIPPYPHPDVLWPVFAARGVELEAEGWVDTEGYVLSSALHPLATAGPRQPGEACYLDELRRRIGARP
jgi:8-oxo-dGTP pyrophosphatase MutT (NUDIX family)